MSKKLSKILTFVAGVIGIIAFYFFIRIVITGDEAIEAMLADDTISDSLVGPFIQFAKIVLVVTALIAVVFSAINLIKQPQVLKKTLISIAVLVVLIIISYSFASDAAVTDALGKVLEGGEAGSVSKWVSTGINFSAILGVVGFGAFFFDFVKALVK